jgi:cytochrome c553
MKKIIVAAACAALVTVTLGAQRGGEAPAAAAPSGPGYPAWAYAITPPPPPGAPRPPAPPEDKEVKHVAGTERSFTVAQIADLNTPADWFPEDHPVMPSIVAHGRQPMVRACAYCHYPNGKGRSSNGGVAGLPVAYILQTLNDFKNGLRKPGDPRKVNVNQMIAFAKNMTPDEMHAAADYFSATPWTQWIRVVEARMVPKTEAEGSIFFKAPGKMTEPIGMRIIETPEDDEQSEPLRNPRSGFIAYAPPGSVKKGEALVMTGGNGRTLACGSCHGADLRGLGPVPGIAGRSPSYLARQMYDIQSGARHGEWAELMKPVVAKLTNEDLINITAYVSSRPMPPAPGSKLQTN